MIRQQQNYHIRMLSRRHLGLCEFYCQIFALDSAVVNQETDVKLAWKLPYYLSNVSPRGNNQIYKHIVMTQRKGLSTHIQSDLKKKPS